MKLPDMFRRNESDERLAAEVERDLQAVDGALAGLDMHPDFDELASLAVAIRDQRPSVDAEFAALLDGPCLSAFSDRALDSGRGARFQHFQDHARRGGADLGNLAERTVRLEVRLERRRQFGDGVGGALVSPLALLRGLYRREIAQQTNGHAVCVDDLFPPGHFAIMDRSDARQ